jgi:hypothetical protein
MKKEENLLNKIQNELELGLKGGDVISHRIA